MLTKPNFELELNHRTIFKVGVCGLFVKKIYILEKTRLATKIIMLADVDFLSALPEVKMG